MASSKDKKVSVKHLQIDKSQSTMLAVIVAATVLTIFGLVATKSLVSKGLYQRRALHARRVVASTLKSNYSSAQTLFTQYKIFADQDPNMLGGSASGSGNLDGDNPRIVLDALPSTYDAPALASSIEKVLTGRGVTINSLTITDDPSTNSDVAQAQPVAKAVKFSFEGTSNYAGSSALLQDFERSIRPFDLNTLEINGSDNALKLTVGMTTYFQPAKSLDLTATKAVK
jgi:hypothetical protein